MVRRIVKSNFITAVNPMATAAAAGQRIITTGTSNQRNGGGITPNPRPGAQQPGESKEAYDQRIQDETGNLMSESEVEKEDTPVTSNKKMLVIGAAVLAIIFLISKSRK